LFPKSSGRFSGGQNAGETSEGSCLDSDFQLICQAIEDGLPTIVLGEKGLFPQLPIEVAKHFQSEFQVALATYKGGVKGFLVSVAEQLDIPIVDDPYAEKPKPLTVDQLKDELLGNTSDRTLFVLPEAKRLTTSIRFWLEDLIAQGVRVVCFAAANPGKDVFLEMVEIELQLPSDREIRQVMAQEATRLGLQLSRSQLTKLQGLAGRNPMLARQVVRNQKLGISRKLKPKHSQYIDVLPIFISMLMGFGIVRFIGMGSGNKSLYIFGGISLIAGMTLKQLGQVRGSRKRLGQ
jgi:hypothetical protein